MRFIIGFIAGFLSTGVAARRLERYLDATLLPTPGPDESEKVWYRPPQMDLAPFPHCDSGILHAPGTCIYCDMYPQRQLGRVESKVNFTGQYLPGYSPCPSEVDRPIEVINRWPGNRASLK